MKKQQLVTLGIVGISLYLIAAGLSFAGFSLYFSKSRPSITIDDNVNTPDQGFVVDPSLPRTEECPMNGQMFTEGEREKWEKRRPIVAMIENHVESRPQSGLVKADVVYEAVAEGGITRFMGVFYCGVAAYNTKIAPVRSVRIYFLNWAAEYGDRPIFMHVGGANDYSGTGDTVRDARALEALEAIGWRTPKGNDFDTTYDVGVPVFVRDTERLSDILGHAPATEHTMVGSLTAAWKEAEKRGFTATDAKGAAWDKTFTKWKFKDEAKEADRGSTSSIAFSAWKGYESEYGVTWTYDRTTNTYKRSMSGKPHTDLESGEQLTAKAIVIQFAKEQANVDRNKHLLYTNIGSGEGLLFQDGNVTKISWRKQDRTGRTKFTDSAGKEVQFSRGQLWIEMLPIGTSVTY